ncbi:hypothetical protein AB0M22_26825 [Nocardia sp. NPDC051756]|uniref:hypothetical protein n=1 Tax=Nocardia sp. NPDC051756 TaxID=3154751 RepID=UPI00344986B1
MSLFKVATTALIAAATLTSCSIDGDAERATVQQILSASAAAAATTPAASTQLRHTTCQQVLTLIADATSRNKADSTWTPAKFVDELITTTQSSPEWQTRSPEDQRAYLTGSRDAQTGSCSY